MAMNDDVYSKNWRPREFLLVKLTADPNGLWQHRRLVKRIEKDRWLTRKADRNVTEENVKPGTKASGAKFATVVNWSLNRTMPARGMRRDQCFLDEDSEKGIFKPEEVDDLVRSHHPARGLRAAELGVTNDMRTWQLPRGGCLHLKSWRIDQRGLLAAKRGLAREKGKKGKMVAHAAAAG